MKKVFSIVAFAAALAFGFTSCKEKPQQEPEIANFKITVDNITATSADVTVEPLDTAATYTLNVYIAEAIKDFSNEELASYIKENIDETIAYYKGRGQKVEYSTFLFKNTAKSQFKEGTFPPRTELIAIAVKMDSNGAIDAKSVTKKSFKSLEVQAKETKNLDFHAAVLIDGTASANKFQIHAAPADSTQELLLTVTSNQPIGKFSYFDCFVSSCLFYNGKALMGLLDLDMTGTANGSKITYDGWFIGQDEIKYNFSFECDKAANAPAKLPSLEPAKEMKNFEMLKSFGYICK